MQQESHCFKRLILAALMAVMLTACGEAPTALPAGTATAIPTPSASLTPTAEPGRVRDPNFTPPVMEGPVHTPTPTPTDILFTWTPTPEPPSTPTPWPKVSGPVEITMDPGPAEGDETAVCVKSLITGREVFCLTLTDVHRNHYHPAEYHDGVLYVLKEVTDDERPGAAQTDELWVYTAPNEGTKLCEDPGLGSFRAAPDNRYVAIEGGPPRASLRFLDPKGKTVRTFTADDLMIADPKARDFREPHLGLEAWTDNGNAFWIHYHSGPSPQAFVTIDVESWTTTPYDVSDLTIPAEYALNPNTGWIAYSDCPAIYDAPAAEAFAESDQEVTLSVYDLNAGTGRDLATVEARHFNRESMASQCFNPEWVDDRTVTYDSPGGEGQITVTMEAPSVAQETYDPTEIPTDVTAWDAHSLPHVDVTLPVLPGWVIQDRGEVGDTVYGVTFQPPVWETPAECGYQCPAISAVIYRDPVTATASGAEAVRTWLERRATPEPFGADVDDSVEFFGVEQIEETTLNDGPAVGFHHESMGIRLYTVLTVVDGTVVGLSKSHVGQFEFEPVFEMMRTHTIVEVASLKASRQALEEQGLGWEEHALVGPPSSLMPLTFNPVEGTQAEILSKHQAERATSARAPCYPECRVSLGDDSLVASATTVDARDGGQKVFVEVLREGETIYSTELGDVCVVSPLWGLWTYGDHWVLEAVHVQAHRQDRAITCEPTGQIIRDGQSLNEQQGYQESFGFQLLNEKPFYFYKRNGQLGVSYDGHEIPLRYTHISHYQCCSGAAANLRSSQSRVAFFARRDGTRYYVEIGVLE